MADLTSISNIGKGEEYLSDPRSKILANAEKAYRKRYNDERKVAEQLAKFKEQLDKKYYKTLDDLESKSLKQRLQNAKAAAKEQYEYATSFSEKAQAKLKEYAINSIQAVDKVVNQASNNVDKYINIYSNYMSNIEARIQGTGKSFSGLFGTINANIGSSQYVSQVKVLEKLNSLVESGITYNMEQRAFLAAISEDIAATFDAFDSSLLRLIKIQQADSTQARLGMEATLTQLFNSTFNDSSYLALNTNTSVTNSLLEALSTMDYQTGVAFEYAVQKWLGSLSSVGVSSNTVSNIAQAIGWLASGDIASLSNSSQSQALIAMAAQRAGLPYANMLTEGVSVNDINRLLRSIIEYTQEISQTSNQVVRSEYGKIFGLTMSDMTAIMSLSASDLDTISNSMLSYSNAISEVQSQLTEDLPERLHLSERINNLFENTMTSVGMNIADNAVSYTTWLVADILKNSVGGVDVSVPVPFVGDLGFNVADTLKTGIVGVGLLSEIGTIINGLSGGKLSVDNNKWNAVEVISKGSGYTPTDKEIYTDTSYTGYIGDSSGQITSMKEAATTNITDTTSDMEVIVEILKAWRDNGVPVYGHVSLDNSIDAALGSFV